MKRTLVAFTMLAAAACTGQALADGNFNYITAQKLAQEIKAGEKLYIIDIQVEPEYVQHHIQGAVPTYAFPVKSAEERAKLDKSIPALKASADPVVIICPRGQGGAERAYSHLAEKGVDQKRLFILEKGQAGFSDQDLTRTGK